VSEGVEGRGGKKGENEGKTGCNAPQRAETEGMSLLFDPTFKGRKKKGGGALFGRKAKRM